MKASSRTLSALAGALLVLAIGALILIRTGSVSETDSRSGTPTLPATPSVSADLEAPAAQDRAPHTEAAAPSPSESSPKGVRLHGIVLDDTTGEPIERFEVLHSPAGAGNIRVSTMLGYENSEPAYSEAFSGTLGRFELPDLGAEAVSVCAFADGYERSEPLTLDAAADAGADVEIRLRKAAVVHGRVLDPSGIPVRDALVAWIDYRGETRPGPRERFERTDELGRFVLGSVPLSARSILAGREDLGEGVSQRLRLEAGELVGEVVIELVRRGS